MLWQLSSELYYFLTHPTNQPHTDPPSIPHIVHNLPVINTKVPNSLPNLKHTLIMTQLFSIHMGVQNK